MPDVKADLPEQLRGKPGSGPGVTNDKKFSVKHMHPMFGYSLSLRRRRFGRTMRVEKFGPNFLWMDQRVQFPGRPGKL